MSEETSWYERNRQHCLELANAYANSHKEERKAYWKQYYEKNKLILSQKRTTYAKKNKDKIYDNYRKRYYKKNYEKKKNKKEIQVKKDIVEPAVSFFAPPAPYRPDITFTRTAEPVTVTWD